MAAIADIIDPPADEPWLPHNEAEVQGLCPQRTDGQGNYWAEHDPRCNMHPRWSKRWALDPDSMRTPQQAGGA